MAHFDLLVIGGGSGGLAHAQRAAEYGANVAIAEAGRLGGTCVNVGCVPKKVMWYAAAIAEAQHLAPDFGFAAAESALDWNKLKLARDAYIKRLNDIYASNLDKRGVTHLQGFAKFVDANTISVDGEQHTADRITIATGGYPSIPDIPGAELGFSSDGFFELESRPERVVVVGSGYIAVELAGVFQGLGSEVTLCLRKDSVIRSFDDMLQSELLSAMTDAGIKIELGFVPASAARNDNGKLTLSATDGREAGGFDGILWAIGRSPNTQDLNLAAAGVKSDAAGFIPVDKFQTTNVDHIFALGDVTGAAALTPVAIAAGRRLADRLWDGQTDRHLEYHTIATVVFSHPQIGTVGLTEDQARAQYGDSVKVYRSRFNPMRYALSEQKVPCTMKLIVQGDDEKVIGLHVIGDGADEMLQGFAVAIRMGATKKHFDDTIAIHPTSAEEFVTMR